MRFRLYREHGALNSKPVFDAFERGLISLGHESVKNDEDVVVIWSVLWYGRMAANQRIYHSGKPVIIIEVGNLIRGTTWRISLGNINRLGGFANDFDLDQKRPEKLGVFLKDLQPVRLPEILIASQHERSQQWVGMPTMTQWVTNTVNTIRKYSDRKIVVRPHPRSPISVKISGVTIEQPKKVLGSYDDFDISYNYHCVVNYNSGPAVQAAINGVPVICDDTSLASEISGKFEEIEKITLPPRDEWFLKLCHTEWTVDEIAQGLPLNRLQTLINC
jgi:hypothetical protein